MSAAPRMSDKDIANEYMAMKAGSTARGLFEYMVKEVVIPRSSLRADRFQDILSMFEDAWPDQKAWEDALAEAERNR